MNKYQVGINIGIEGCDANLGWVLDTKVETKYMQLTLVQS